MAADSRFEIVRRGYDPQPVERELKALSAELVRLKEQNAELQAETSGSISVCRRPNRNLA